MDHEDIWLVQLGNGAVRAMTLDELDAAYQEGAIDEDTYVRRDGASKWSRLRDEIGGDEPAAPAPLPAPAPVPVISYGAVPAYAHAHAAQPAQPMQPMQPTQPTPQPAFYSTRPVVSEVDLDELELGSPFKKSRKGTYAAIGAVAVAAIATAVFGATRMSGAPADAVKASVAAAAQPPPQVVTPPPATPTPASTLSDAQRKELSEMDKKNSSTWEQRRKARELAAPHYHYHRSHTPFHKGGNKYDPLNAKL
jgi:hypothetical protein